MNNCVTAACPCYTVAADAAGVPTPPPAAAVVVAPDLDDDGDDDNVTDRWTQTRGRRANCGCRTHFAVGDGWHSLQRLRQQHLH